MTTTTATTTPRAHATGRSHTCRARALRHGLQSTGEQTDHQPALANTSSPVTTLPPCEPPPTSQLASKIRSSNAAHEKLLKSTTLIQAVARGWAVLKAFQASKRAAVRIQAEVSCGVCAGSPSDPAPPSSHARRSRPARGSRSACSRRLVALPSRWRVPTACATRCASPRSSRCRQCTGAAKGSRQAGSGKNAKT